jgi:hypothetical protein
MSRVLRVLPLGGCQVHNPLNALHKERLVDASAFKSMGFRRTPVSVTMATTRQLAAYLVGDLELPDWFKSVTWEQVEGLAPSIQVIRDQDYAFLEFFTTQEICVRGLYLNNNTFQSAVIGELAKIGPEEARLGRLWLNDGVFKQQEGLREQYARDITAILPIRSQRDEWLHMAIDEARGVTFALPERIAMLEEVGKYLQIPMALCVHVFKYLSDARPVSWPPDFITESLALAEASKLPIFNPAPMVERLGVAEVLGSDSRHYRPDRYLVVGHEMLHFLNRLTGNNIGFSHKPAPHFSVQQIV